MCIILRLQLMIENTKQILFIKDICIQYCHPIVILFPLKSVTCITQCLNVISSTKLNIQEDLVNVY